MALAPWHRYKWVGGWMGGISILIMGCLCTLRTGRFYLVGQRRSPKPKTQILNPNQCHKDEAEPLKRKKGPGHTLAKIRVQGSGFRV